jgi:hypothetical protein
MAARKEGHGGKLCAALICYDHGFEPGFLP